MGQRNDEKPLSMVLTGVQGTGKSVLGAFLALVFSQVGWRVTYRWGNTAYTFGGDIVNAKKKITVWDASEQGPSITAGSGYFLIVSSCDEKRWHELAQQESWSDQGYGIPLNLTNVPVMAVVSNVIEEFRVAFNSPFLHLGYDERKESMPCLKEAKIKVDFDKVEQKILALLSVLDISPGLVLRWESSEDVPSDSDRMRAGAITHYHYSNPPKDASIPFFVSTDVRFDRSNDDAYEIYQTARKYATEHEMILGLLAGTMEMSPSAWNGRNVEGKLVALAMGLSATKSDLDLEEFKKLYTKTCYELKIEGDTATKLFGKSRWTEDRWQEELESERLRRSNSTCARMTGEVPSRKMKDEILA